MPFEFWLMGLSYGLLLFLLCAGLTLVYSIMGVLNFAHASFYMIGAYVAYQVSAAVGFGTGMILAPVIVAILGLGVERYGLRQVRQQGHLAEMLLTFGLAYCLTEGVTLIWGRNPVSFELPAWAQGHWQYADTAFPRYRLLVMAVSLAALLAMAVLLRWSQTGLLIQAALRHPLMLASLGYSVERLQRRVFVAGCALAGLAGALGGPILVVEPGMGHFVGSLLFVVVVVGGLGSLVGAMLASLAIGVLQTAMVSMSVEFSARFGGIMPFLGCDRLDLGLWCQTLSQLRLAQLAPLLPFALMVLVLVFRPHGLMGRRT